MKLNGELPPLFKHDDDDDDDISSNFSFFLRDVLRRFIISDKYSEDMVIILRDKKIEENKCKKINYINLKQW
jgi:hypothetical protein